MKRFLGILFLLPLYVVTVRSAPQNDYNDFPQIEPPGFSVSDQDADTNRPMAEKIKLFLTYSAYGFSNKVAKLVEAGVPANSTNSAGDTALTVLPRKVRPELKVEEITGLARYLIQHGAEVEAKDKKGKLAADYAAEYGWYELLSIVDVSGKYKSKYQDKKNVEAQNILLGAVGDLVMESITSNGNFSTESHAKVKTISDALKNGASPDQEVMLQALGGASSEDYWLPFGQIMPEAISCLIKAGAKINEPLSNGLQPLFYAVSKPKLFRLLLDVVLIRTEPAL